MIQIYENTTQNCCLLERWSLKKTKKCFLKELQKDADNVYCTSSNPKPKTSFPVFLQKQKLYAARKAKQYVHVPCLRSRFSPFQNMYVFEDVHLRGQCAYSKDFQDNSGSSIITTLCSFPVFLVLDVLVRNSIRAKRNEREIIFQSIGCKKVAESLYVRFQNACNAKKYYTLHFILQLTKLILCGECMTIFMNYIIVNIKFLFSTVLYPNYFKNMLSLYNIGIRKFTGRTDKPMRP